MQRYNNKKIEPEPHTLSTLLNHFPVIYLFSFPLQIANKSKPPLFHSTGREGSTSELNLTFLALNSPKEKDTHSAFSDLQN
ncbi:hypothetical protein X975_23981, partial [Stegodyphus mimosarum]